MSKLTEEDLKFIEKTFGLKRVAETIQVRDGMLSRGEMVWWRCVDGPEHVNSEYDWRNIIAYPQAYSINKPKIKVEYLNE